MTMFTAKNFSITLNGVPLITEKFKMEHKKDYSLLRPFDLEAAKRGEKICTDELEDVQYVAGPDEYTNVVVKTGPYFILQKHRLRMTPIAWVEGRPIYNGDVLYCLSNYANWADIERGYEFKVSKKAENEDALFDGEWWLAFTDLTWTKPKQKREGWMNCYPSRENCVYPSKEMADKYAASHRTECIRIEWEE